MSTGVELGLRVVVKEISEMQEKLNRAVLREDWESAASLSAYVRGMKQAEIIFRQAVSGVGQGDGV